MEKMEVEKTLYWYDGPMIFTSIIKGKRLLMTLICDADNAYGYMGATITDEVLSAVEENNLSLYGAYTSSDEMFVITCDRDWNVIGFEPTTPIKMRQHMPEPSAGISIGRVPDTFGGPT